MFNPLMQITTIKFVSNKDLETVWVARIYLNKKKYMINK